MCTTSLVIQVGILHAASYFLVCEVLSCLLTVCAYRLSCACLEGFMLHCKRSSFAVLWGSSSLMLGGSGVTKIELWSAMVHSNFLVQAVNRTVAS